MASQKVVVVLPKDTESSVAEIFVTDPDIEVSVMGVDLMDETRMAKPVVQYTKPLTDAALEEARVQWGALLG
jgi:hypothetical protein